MSNVLGMLQTNSNQPFIFSSPRLREQIGASFEITLLSHWVKEEAEKLLKPKPLPASFWVSDSSGKVIVRFTEADGDSKELAKRLIREVTLRALTDAPGLDIRQSRCARPKQARSRVPEVLAEPPSGGCALPAVPVPGAGR